MSSHMALENLPYVRKNIVLAGYSWFGIGGHADFFFSAGNLEDTKQVISAARSDGVPVFIIGSGSNLLFQSSGFRGLVIKVCFEDFTFSGGLIRTGAGVQLKALMEKSASFNLGGWEGLYGIPGTVGGAVRGNAGAYGVEIGDFVERVSFLDFSPLSNELKNEELRFGYRHSVFKEKEGLIFEVSLRLKEVDAPASLQRMKEIEIERRKKHPQRNTAGCFFKNPKDKGYTAAYLIESSGLKGKSVGKAQVSSLHSNFIINTGGATSSDIMSLAAMIKEEVYRKFSILLEEEVEIVPEYITARY